MYFGISTPFTRGLNGYPKTSVDYDKIDEAIGVILSTVPGERVFRPTFGCNLYKFIFEPIEVVSVVGVDEIVRALRAWEPRIMINNIYVDAVDESRVEITIDYILVADNEQRNKKIIFRKRENIME